MKSPLLLAIAILSITATAHAGVSARITLHRAPALNSVDRAGYRPNAMTGIELNTQVGTGTTAFTPLPDDYVASPWDIVTYNNSRPRLEAGLDVVSSEPISLARITLRVRSSDGTISFDEAYAGTYTTTRHGISYGSDGRKGTSDDPPHTMNGSATFPFQEIVYMGFGIYYETPTLADAEKVQKYFAERNISVTFEYLLDGIVIASKTVQFTQTPIPPFRLSLIAEVTPNGIIVAGQPLQLAGSVRNDGPHSYTGMITNVWQLQLQRIDGLTGTVWTDWTDWQSAGIFQGIALQETKLVTPFSWSAGVPEPTIRYAFRLKSMTALGNAFSQEEVRVLPTTTTVTTPPQAGRLTIVTLEQASPGTYTLQRATNLGDWENVATVTINGDIQGFVIPQGTSSKTFFRTVRVQ